MAFRRYVPRNLTLRAADGHTKSGHSGISDIRDVAGIRA